MLRIEYNRTDIYLVNSRFDIQLRKRPSKMWYYCRLLAWIFFDNLAQHRRMQLLEAVCLSDVVTELRDRTGLSRRPCVCAVNTDRTPLLNNCARMGTCVTWIHSVVGLCADYICDMSNLHCVFEFRCKFIIKKIIE